MNENETGMTFSLSHFPPLGVTFSLSIDSGNFRPHSRFHSFREDINGCVVSLFSNGAPKKNPWQ